MAGISEKCPFSAYNSVATSYNGNVTLAQVGNPGHDILDGQPTVQAEHGRIAFTDLVLAQAGTDFVLQARNGRLTPATTRDFLVES